MTSRPKGWGQEICDDSTKALEIYRMMMGGGGFENCPNLCDFIYGRPLMGFEES